MFLTADADKDYRGLFVAVVLLLMAPVVLVEYLPMVDIPGHLARIYILQHYEEVPQFQQVYELSRNWSPYQTMDRMILLLMQGMSIYQAARAFVVLGMIVFAAGCWTLSYSIYGRITPLAVLALFLQYNSTFFYGYVALQLGVGLALVTIGLWYRWRGIWTVPRVCVLTMLAVGTYITHLGGYMYLGVGVGWLTLRMWWQQKRISPASLIGLVPLLPPVCLYLFLFKDQGAVNQIIFSNLPQKLRHASILLVGYNLYVDAAVVTLLLVAAVAGWKYGRYRLHPEFGSLSIVFGALFLVMPWWLLTASDADARMVLGAGVFFLLALQCELPPFTGKLIYAVALLAFVWRIVFIGWVWTGQSELIRGHIAFLDQIPQGARVYPVARFPDEPQANKRERVLAHLPDLATVERQAVVPTTFAVRGQHTLVERGAHWYKPFLAPARPELFDWNLVAKEYDAIWQYGPDPVLRKTLDDRFTLTAEHGDARLYLLKKKAAADPLQR